LLVSLSQSSWLRSRESPVGWAPASQTGHLLHVYEGWAVKGQWCWGHQYTLAGSPPLLSPMSIAHVLAGQHRANWVLADWPHAPIGLASGLGCM
jgi:hypothetical protein